MKSYLKLYFTGGKWFAEFHSYGEMIKQVSRPKIQDIAVTVNNWRVILKTTNNNYVSYTN